MEEQNVVGGDNVNVGGVNVDAENVGSGQVQGVPADQPRSPTSQRPEVPAAPRPSRRRPEQLDDSQQPAEPTSPPKRRQKKARRGPLFPGVPSLQELASRHIVHNADEHMVNIVTTPDEVPPTLVTKLREGVSKRSGGGKHSIDEMWKEWQEESGGK